MTDLPSTGLCLHGCRRGWCYDQTCTYSTREAKPPTSRTRAGTDLLARELWEWLPEAYQMSRARLAEVVEAIENEAAALNPSEGAREQELRQALLNVALAYTPDGPCYCDPPDTGEPHDPRCDAARRLLASNQRAEGQEGSGQG